MRSNIQNVAASVARVIRATVQSANPLSENESCTPETVTFASKGSAFRAVQVGRDTAKSIQHILRFDDLPRWMQVDPYIRRGYRRQLDSFGACFCSVFYLHNESVNTWSHLLPALSYISILAIDYSILHGGVDLLPADSIVLQIYVAGSISCLLCSVCASAETIKSTPLTPLQAFFHAVTAHSQDVAHRFLKLDYLGILLNVSTTALTFVYVGLYGNACLQAFYLSILMICTTVVFRAILSPRADGTQAALWRFAHFISC